MQKIGIVNQQRPSFGTHVIPFNNKTAEIVEKYGLNVKMGINNKSQLVLCSNDSLTKKVLPKATTITAKKAEAFIANFRNGLRGLAQDAIIQLQSMGMKI